MAPASSIARGERVRVEEAPSTEPKRRAQEEDLEEEDSYRSLSRLSTRPIGRANEEHANPPKHLQLGDVKRGEDAKNLDDSVVETRSLRRISGLVSAAQGPDGNPSAPTTEIRSVKRDPVALTHACE